MATIRKRNSRYQVQVRRRGHPPQSKTFFERKDAQAWARQMEANPDRLKFTHWLGEDYRATNQFTLVVPT